MTKTGNPTTDRAIQTAKVAKAQDAAVAEGQARDTDAAIAKLTALGRGVMEAIATGQVGFFDDGLAAGSNTWGEVLAQETGVKAGVLTGLVKQGLFTTGTSEEGTGMYLTDLGAAVANRLREDAAAKPAKKAAKAAPKAEKPAAAPKAPKAERVLPAIPAGFALKYDNGGYLLAKADGSVADSAKWTVICTAHGTTTTADAAKAGDALGRKAARAGWCKSCK